MSRGVNSFKNPISNTQSFSTLSITCTKYHSFSEYCLSLWRHCLMASPVNHSSTHQRTKSIVLELVPSHAYHDITRDEPTGIESLFRLDTERHLRDLLVQQLARHKVTDAELVAYPQCPGVLAHAGWSNEGGKRGV